MQKDPLYGTSLHYDGTLGSEYFNWQNSHGEIDGRIDAQKFKRFDFTNSIVLDFGAGAGNLLNNLIAKDKRAVEINVNAHGILKERGITTYSTIEDVPSGIVDFVISHHSLEHVPYPIEALREMKRILKKGGSLLLWVPIDDWKNQKRFNAKDINHHLNTWTPQLIGNSLVEAGFSSDVIEARIVSHAWFPFYFYFYRYPGFDFICKIWARFRRSHQISVQVQNI